MREERGHVMLLATILGVVAFSAWALAFLTTRDLIRTERLIRVRSERDDSVTRALAQGLRLLRTDMPPYEPYACVMKIAGEKDSYACTVTFQMEGTKRTWSVTAGRSTEEEMGTLPPAPQTFGEKDADAGTAAEVQSLEQLIQKLKAALESKPEPNEREKKELEAELQKAKEDLEALQD